MEQVGEGTARATIMNSNEMSIQTILCFYGANILVYTKLTYIYYNMFWLLTAMNTPPLLKYYSFYKSSFTL